MWVPGIRQWVHFPCKRWSCSVCGRRKSRETARLLFLDSMLSAPSHAVTLTTAVPWEDLDPAVYRRASAALWRRLRRHYGRVDYCGFIEFTTGRAERSGGRRRMHGHYLVKLAPGLEPDVLEVEALVRSTWEASTGAYMVEVAQLHTPGAAMAYLSLHHQKPQQAPPEGWSGMRFRASKGYWSLPVADLRAAAKLTLREEAIEWTRTMCLTQYGVRRLPGRVPSGASRLRVM